jgi:hypothetical protein
VTPPKVCRALNCAAWDDRREARVPGTGCGHKIFNSGCLWSEKEREAAMRAKR